MSAENIEYCSLQCAFLLLFTFILIVPNKYLGMMFLCAKFQCGAITIKYTKTVINKERLPQQYR